MRSVMKLKPVICSVILLASLPLTVAAQQSNQQAALLIEMQNLRQEVAELRDMVERQQFQIRKLQQQTPASNSTAPAAMPTRQMPQPTQPWQNAEQPASSSNQQSQPSVPVNAPTASNSTGNSSTDYQSSNYPETDNRTQTSVPVQNPQVNSSEYYRQGAPSSPEQTSSAREYVEQQSQQYPPVVDRSIGGNAQTVEDSNYESAPVTQQRPAYPVNNQTAPASQPTMNNTGAVNGGVIAVPNTNRTQAPIAQPQRDQAVVQQPIEERKPIPGMSEMDYYQQGFDLLKKSKEDDAVAVFRQQLETYPNGEYAADAYFWIADSMYVNRKLDESKKNFRQIIDNFKQSPRVPFAMLKTAYIEQEQGNMIEARMLLQEIIQHYPQSDAAISAKNRISALK